MKITRFQIIIIICFAAVFLFNGIMTHKDLFSVYGGVEKLPVLMDVDFSLYYTGARMLLSGQNENLYNAEAVEEFAAGIGHKHLKGRDINYPAIQYFFMIPLALLPYEGAWKLWFFLNLLFLANSILLLVLTFFNNYNDKIQSLTVLFLLGFFLFFSPVIDCLALGQVNLFLLFIMSLCIYLYTRLKDDLKHMAGIPLGLAIALKVLPAPTALYFLWKKDWKTLSAIAASFFIFTVLPWFVFGFHLLTDYLNVKDRYFFFVSGVQDTSVRLFWLFVMEKLGIWGSSLPNILYITGSFLLLGITLYVISGRNEASLDEFSKTAPLDIALLTMLICLITPFSWSHHHVLNIIPITAFLLILWKSPAPGVLEYILLGILGAACFIIGSSDASFVPYYLYAESMKIEEPLQKILWIPVIHIKAFFRNNMLLFLSNLFLWLTGVILRQFSLSKKVSH